MHVASTCGSRCQTCAIRLRLGRCSTTYIAYPQTSESAKFVKKNLLIYSEGQNPYNVLLWFKDSLITQELLKL